MRSIFLGSLSTWCKHWRREGQPPEREAWEEAWKTLTEADSEEALSPSDLELLADAAWWTAHPDESVDALERAFNGHVAADMPMDAARVAVLLAYLAARRLAGSVANGWRARAVRLLEGQPEVDRPCIAEGDGCLRSYREPSRSGRRHSPGRRGAGDRPSDRKPRRRVPSASVQGVRHCWPGATGWRGWPSSTKQPPWPFPEMPDSGRPATSTA